MISTASTPTPSRAELLWRCRRGMLELDLLLHAFLANDYAVLSPQGQRAFEALLNYPDPDLFEYLMGRALPTDKEVADVITAIRHTADS